jgi:hypothetical protein
MRLDWEQTRDLLYLFVFPRKNCSLSQWRRTREMKMMLISRVTLSTLDLVFHCWTTATIRVTSYLERDGKTRRDSEIIKNVSPSKELVWFLLEKKKDLEKIPRNTDSHLIAFFLYSSWTLDFISLPQREKNVHCEKHVHHSTWFLLKKKHDSVIAS